MGATWDGSEAALAFDRARYCSLAVVDMMTNDNESTHLIPDRLDGQLIDPAVVQSDFRE